VENADCFGLSQLYQIKGRVGRGSRIAYAYLTYREKKNMNDEAVKRLQAIQEFTELGSGYKIAQRDLMIRGAGDILGPEQAGFIDSVGLDLYLKMLNEAVEERKRGVAPTPPRPSKMLSGDAYIPAEYASKSDKLQLYQELEDQENEAGIAAFLKKIRDIYGVVPKEVNALVTKKRINLLLESEEFKALADYPERVDVDMSNYFVQISGIANALFDALVPYLNVLRVTYHAKQLRLSLVKSGDWLTTLVKVLTATHKCYLKRKPEAV
ncbi:MAG: transcription-repair coupling factor, partial [Bacilli bacterium]|nr:transcription-repair coupling factor [Bacilli bacterium]